MTTFKILFRTESNGDYSGFSTNEYSAIPCDNEEQVLKDFLTPENFKHEDFHVIKRLDKYKSDGFPGHALNLRTVTLEDFRKVGKKKIVTLLDSIVKPKTDDATPEPGLPTEIRTILDKKPDVTYERINTQKSDRYVLDKLISVIQAAPTDTFYIASKHFFDLSQRPEQYDENNKLTWDAICYEPYIVIIWFDSKGVLKVCEYLAD